MSYYLYMNQSGEGCDYTIGCGQKLLALKASTIEEAIEEAIEEVDHHLSEEVPDVLLLKSTGVFLSAMVEKRRAEHDKQVILNEAKKQEVIDRAELTRLKAKLGEL